MSQKKAKKLRKVQAETLIEQTNSEPVKGVRQILKENWKFLLILCVGIFVLYFNSLCGDFVSDDYAMIPNNSDVGNFLVMVKDPANFSNYLIYKVFGNTSTVAYHVYSLITYLLFCCLALVVLETIFNDKWLSRTTMIIFAVMPIHVEVVSWISGRIYLILSICIMAGFLSFILFERHKKIKYLLITLVFFIIGFLTDKPRPFALFFVIFTYFLYKGFNAVKINLKTTFTVITVMFTLLAFIAWPSIKTRVNSVNSGYNGYGSVFYDPFFQYPTSVAKYLQLALVPTDLTLYHTMYILPTWLNWLIILTYFGATAWFYFKDKKIFFALAFIFAATAPSMAPVKVSWLVAERYLFLGSLGVSLFLVLFLKKITNKYILTTLIVLLVLIFSIRTYFRNIDWQTNHNLWVNTCQVSPNSHNAWNNIGDDYDKLAQLEITDEGKMKQYLNSVKGFTQSVTVKPNYADAYHNRANIFYKIGRYDLAKDSYETALSYGPNLYQSYYSLLQIDLVEKNYNSAMDHLNKLNTVKPNDPQVYFTAAVVYSNMGQVDQAVSILEQLVKVNPNWTQANDLLNQIKTSKNVSIE